MILNRIAHRAWMRARRPDVLSSLRELESSERLPAHTLRAMQQEHLLATLVHASEKVPYYRDIFRSRGIDPVYAGASAALEALPVLTKEIIRERREDLIAEDADRRGAAGNATGGSTGRPLTFLQDRSHRRWNQAALYRGFLWTGWKLGDPIAYLWGSDIDARNHRGRGAVRDAVVGVTWVDAFTLDDAAMDHLLARLGSESRHLLVGYASSLALLARHALARGGGPRIRAVQSSAELLVPEVRALIEQAFGCRVYDRYGCREAGVVAHECGEGSGWHINAENVLVETDSRGNLLLTTLMNFAMPLIRYANEDLGAFGGGRCACGRGLPLLSRIIGRRTDIIRSPSGRSIHGEFFTHLFYGAEGVREFQVRQRSIHNLHILVAAGEPFGEESRRSIESAILQHGDGRFRVTWESVPRVPRASSGKHRFVICEIEDDPPASEGA